jgi:hypothetical protein
MLALGGPVLAVGGCALFLANLNIEGSHNGSDSLSALGAIVFIAGCLAFVIGILWAIARWIDRRFNKAKAAGASTTSTASTSTPGTASTSSTSTPSTASTSSTSSTDADSKD